MGQEQPEGDGQEATERTLIYIAGYGRSGSTLLGRLIASTGKALDVGEVGWAPLFLRKPNYRCSCGAKTTTCPIWSELPVALRELPQKPADSHTHTALLRGILNLSEQPTIVDSSKTAGFYAFRPYLLSRRLRVRLYLVHLVRDPRAVAWSVVRDRRSRRAKPSVWRDVLLSAKVCLVWQLANLAAELQAFWFSPDVVRVRYDHLVQYGLQRPFWDVFPAGPLDGVAHDSKVGDYHSMSGNVMRYDEKVVVKLDDAWRRQMPPYLRHLVTGLSFPFIVRYRFGLRSDEVG